jgi:hypothetical protein
MLCSSARVRIRKLLIPFGAKEGVRCNQCAGADSRDHGESGPRARLRKTDQSARTERTIGAPTGQSQNVEGLRGPHLARSLRHTRDGELCELLVGAQCSYGFRRLT